MKKLIVSDIAKNGVQEDRLIKYQVDNNSKKLIREANEQIKANQNSYANIYKKAASYFVR